MVVVVDGAVCLFKSPTNPKSPVLLLLYLNFGSILRISFESSVFHSVRSNSRSFALK